MNRFVKIWYDAKRKRWCHCCNSSWTRCCVLLIVVWPLVAYYVDHAMKQQETPDGSRETPDGSMETPDGSSKEIWLSDRINPYHMTDMLSQSARPVLLTSTPYDKWTIWDWSFDSLAANVDLVLVKKSSHRIIKYFGTSQMMLSKPLERPYKEMLFPAKKFFEKLTGESDGHYYYASGGIELLGLKSRDVYSEDLLREVTFRSHGSLGQVNFWIGAGNVTAHTHYDTSHNLHVVITGRKKFLLWPPSAYDSLGLYPCLHHYYRQTRYTYTESPTIVPTPIEIVVQPSDAIYIPPYWFHEVVTMEPSISINVWSDSDTFLVMEEVYKAPIPFEEHWDQVTMMKVLWYFLSHLFGMVTRESTRPGDIIRTLVSKRYDALDDSITHGSPGLANYCLKEGIEDVLDTHSIMHVEKGSSTVARLFLQIPCLATREINVGNYIEHLCLRILGGDQLNLLLAILSTCYTT